MGLRWSSILVDCKCWMRLKKSSLGIVLFREVIDLGSGDLWSLMRELCKERERDKKELNLWHCL